VILQSQIEIEGGDNDDFEMIWSNE